jgi:hypothetical protein
VLAIAIAFLNGAKMSFRTQLGVMLFWSLCALAFAANGNAQDLTVMKAKAHDVIAAIEEFGKQVRIQKCDSLLKDNATGWYAYQIFTKVSNYDIKKTDSVLTPFILYVEVSALNINNTNGKNAQLIGKYKWNEKSCYASKEDAIKYFNSENNTTHNINPSRAEYEFTDGRFKLLRSNEVFTNIFLKTSSDEQKGISKILDVIIR